MSVYQLWPRKRENRKRTTLVVFGVLLVVVLIVSHKMLPAEVRDGDLFVTKKGTDLWAAPGGRHSPDGYFRFVVASEEPGVVLIARADKDDEGFILASLGFWPFRNVYNTWIRVQDPDGNIGWIKLSWGDRKGEP